MVTGPDRSTRTAWGAPWLAVNGRARRRRERCGRIEPGVAAARAARSPASADGAARGVVVRAGAMQAPLTRRHVFVDRSPGYPAGHVTHHGGSFLWPARMRAEPGTRVRRLQCISPIRPLCRRISPAACGPVPCAARRSRIPGVQLRAAFPLLAHDLAQPFDQGAETHLESVVGCLVGGLAQALPVTGGFVKPDAAVDLLDDRVEDLVLAREEIAQLRTAR